MNLEKDYSSQVINLSPDYEGDVIAVLITSNFNVGHRRSVLYLHGYIDYFFHPHLGEKFNQNNYDFYALDLRKYGRSLLKHHHPNYCKSIEEYFEEISIAIRKIKSKSDSIYLLGHSTGGLIASSYMNKGEEREHIHGLILNSPFLDFNQTRFEKLLICSFANIISKIAVYSKMIGALAPAYAQSIHKEYYGEWEFNLEWKPIKGFPTFFKWIVAIARAQKKLNDSNITVPILIMHAAESMKTSTFSEDVMTKDIVLNVEDMKRVGSKLGNDVTLFPTENAMHDIFLSAKEVREDAFNKMFSWLSKNWFEEIPISNHKT